MQTGWYMVKKLFSGILCMLASVAGQAGTSAGQIGVQITLSGAPPAPTAAAPASTAAASCTSRSGAATGSTSVQVICNSDVYVNIAQVSLSREAVPSVAGQFITGFGLARSSGFFELVSGQFDDAVAQADQGWNFEGWIYAGNETPGQSRQLVKQRLRQTEGTLTALGVTRENGHPGAVEMLVSF